MTEPSKERKMLADQEGGGKQKKVSSMVLQDCEESTNPDEKEVLMAESGLIVRRGNLH